MKGNPPTLLTVIGTRPQYVKYAALAPLPRHAFRNVLVDTGQHHDALLSETFRKEYDIRDIEHTLDTGTHVGLPRLASLLSQLNEVIDVHSPDALLCFGDTDSALAAALAAIKHSVPVFHIEAGERSRSFAGTRVHPATIPEESNRVAIDHLASLLLCSTDEAKANCEEEQCRGTLVFSGDIMYDLFLRAHSDEERDHDVLRRYDLEPRSYHFCTVHRPINTDSPVRLRSLLATLSTLDLPVILALHPRTADRMRTFHISPPGGQLRIVDALPHRDTIALARQSSRVLTDSGGLTREAYFCGVPSICLDDATAWYALCRLGWCHLTGADDRRIRHALAASSPSGQPALFGNGNAAVAVIDAVSSALGNT